MVLKQNPSIPANPFVWQMVAEKMFMSSLDSSDLQHAQSRQPQRLFSDVEKNAIRYAAGYVVRKLKKKFQKRQSLLVCYLNRLISDETDLDDPEASALEAAIEPEAEDDFEAYTKVWLKRTDRGGLLQINNDTFALFLEIELVVYNKLQKLLAGEKKTVAELTAATVEDVDIRFIWSVVSNFEEEESEHAQYLLSRIVQEWVVLRGHSLCGHYIEEYKRAVDETKKKSLRKELKHNEEESTK